MVILLLSDLCFAQMKSTRRWLEFLQFNQSHFWFPEYGRIGNWIILEILIYVSSTYFPILHITVILFWYPNCSPTFNLHNFPKVFPCISATCGHFFHPKCVSELLYPGDKCRSLELQKEIVAGESFTCPAHKCSVCKQGEDKKEFELQFAICRRCPRAYHRRCLPRFPWSYCLDFECFDYIIH